MFFGSPSYPVLCESILCAHSLLHVYILRALFILGSFLALPFALAASFSDSIFHISLSGGEHQQHPHTHTYTQTHTWTDRETYSQIQLHAQLLCLLLLPIQSTQNKMCVPDDDDDDVACPVRFNKVQPKDTKQLQQRSRHKNAKCFCVFR